MTPEERARKCAELMMANDVASPAMGITLADVGPGHARMTMKVRADMLNGHFICHGGFIFALADSTFAFACNSYNRNAVAQQNQITYLSPGKEGEVLTATATEASLTGRSGVYDVVVTADDGRKVALFRGLSRMISGQHFDEDETT